MNTLAIAVEGLRKVYRRGSVLAVDGVSLSAERGEVVGLLGPNGAGKTTTIKCLCTLVRPTAGRVLVEGVDAIATPRAAVERIAAVLEGNRNVYWRLTVRENLELFAALHGLRRSRARVEELIDRLRLGDKASTPARMLSRGMQQKLALGCALVKDTPVVVLDEPTLGLDVESSHEVRALLREWAGRRTILLSSHDMAVVQDVCDRVVVMAGGRVVADDRVENLLGLFRARAYTFTLAAPIPAREAALLSERYPMTSFATDGAGATVEVELLEGDDFYGIVDVLRSAGAVVESVDRRDPNLEEIFLSIVRGGGTKEGEG